MASRQTPRRYRFGESDDSGSDTSFWNVNSMGRAGRRTITKCVLVSSWDFTLEGETEANDRSCYAVNVGPIGKDTAASGTHYQVAITARCYKDGVPFAEQKTKLEVFKFVNYKHWIDLTGQFWIGKK